MFPLPALNIASNVLGILIVILASAQFWMVYRYCQVLRRSWLAYQQTPPEQTGQLPPVAVVLCLRGEDPSLHRCLAGLAQQEYPAFRLYVVADNGNDPALETLQLMGGEFSQEPTLVTLTNISTDRSLKCSALLAAFEQITDDDFRPRFIALVDSDIYCDPRWLNDLVQPLVQPGVGATTGNRWFEPADHMLGSWLRHVWNAASVVQMHHYNIAWGGSLAFKASLISQEKFLQPLRTGFCEDTGINTVLEEFDLQLLRVPGLIASSSESTTASKCLAFIVRQLLTVRLYHWSWPWIVTHGVSIALFNIATFFVLILSVATGFEPAHLLPLAALVVFQLLNFYLLHRIGNANRTWLRERGQEMYPCKSMHTYFLGVILIQFAHAFAILAARFKKVFSWRQIKYRVEGGQSVTMLKYQPFQPTTIDDGRTTTIEMSID